MPLIDRLLSWRRESPIKNEAPEELAKKEVLAVKPRINPLAAAYYQDSTAPSGKKEDVISVSNISSEVVSKGWNSQDTLSPALSEDKYAIASRPSTATDSSIITTEVGPKEVSESVLLTEKETKVTIPLDSVLPSTISTTSAPLVGDNVEITPETVSSVETIELLDEAYQNVPAALREEIEATLPQQVQGPALLNKHMEILSKQIDAALSVENRNFEKIHALILRFCMIHMRNVAKDDQEYIAKIGEQILVQSGKIKETYNTWPVLVVTLVSSGVSIFGGLGGFSHLFIDNAWTQALNTHAQQLGTMSTGISGVSSLLNSRNEGDRQVLQLLLKRKQDQEEEKKGAKHGTKESQKLFRDAQKEVERNRNETLREIVRTG